ncbi:MAG: hypothetical protein K2W81_05920 [Sphingomonas sp.]|uniref:hypothetical protein n=1 Tax=Sphingomonas sp. TaxID=28214 RepID=UPI0025D82F89|nr:hypothetical protein [Sphingomonas sp.]MBY0283482.1 hypothetical protein [Sphingomonas sp.]
MAVKFSLDLSDKSVADSVKGLPQSDFQKRAAEMFLRTEEQRKTLRANAKRAGVSVD